MITVDLQRLSIAWDRKDIFNMHGFVNAAVSDHLSSCAYCNGEISKYRPIRKMTTSQELDRIS